MKKFILPILLFFCVSKNVKAQYVTIPDANFALFLQQNYANCMSGNLLDTTCFEILNESWVDASFQGISDLTGIKYFTNLLYLSCHYNQLSFLPLLPPSLTVLACYNNLLTSLPNLPVSLTELHCNYNQITNLPQLPNSLGILRCDNNQLTNLPSLPSNLKELYCSTNQLSNLPTLSDSLKNLICNENQLSSLPTLPNTLINLICGNNQLTTLPSLPSGLEYFHCENNLINCFPIFPSSIVDPMQFAIYNNPATCLPNYIPAMDVQALAIPLCAESDYYFNPNQCPLSTGILGITYNDESNDCILNNGDNKISNIPLKLMNQANLLIGQTFSASNGVYQFPIEFGIYTIKIDLNNSPFIIQCLNNNDVDTSLTLDNTNFLIDNINFPLTCKSGFDIGTKSILTNGWVFPGQTHDLKITAGDLSQFYNFSCASGVSGQVQIFVSGPVSYQTNAAGTLTPLVNGNTYTYDIADFGSTDIFSSFALIFQTDTTAQAGDQICVSVSVTPELGDNNPSNNLYEFCYEVVNSYDPNLKEVYPVNVAPGYADYFTYTIHFQNTGSAPAFNIRLLDTLDANLDLETFQILNYSHYQTANVRNNVLTFHFPNIQLPDSTSNPEGSKGYVQYRIKPKANLALGTQIKNTANIYFDYNDPIVTNTTVNEYVITNSLHENEPVSVKVYPNPFSSSTTIAFAKALTNVDINLYNVYGHEVRKISNFSGTKLSIQKESLTAGIYFLQVRNEEHSQKIKLMITE